MADIEERQELIDAIAEREGTAQEIAKWFGYRVSELRAFVDENKEEIERRAIELSQPNESSEPSPTQLDELWITNKFERLKRLQKTADLLYIQILAGSIDSTILREFRSYTTTVANELGQLLHRGSGESGTGDSLAIEIEGIDMDKLR